MARRQRLDAELVRRQLVDSRVEAARAIDARRVLVNGALADKASRQVHPGDAIVVQGDPPRFVSRGGDKLDAALDAFGLDVTGWRVLDAGGFDSFDIELSRTDKPDAETNQQASALLKVTVKSQDADKVGRAFSGAITEIDQEQLFSAVTKLAMSIETAAQIPDIIRVLLQAATTGRPGPVVAIFPEDVFDEHASVTIPEMSATVPLDREPASARATHKAAELLAAAERPAVVAGVPAA